MTARLYLSPPAPTVGMTTDDADALLERHRDADGADLAAPDPDSITARLSALELEVRRLSDFILAHG